MTLLALLFSLSISAGPADAQPCSASSLATCPSPNYKTVNSSSLDISAIGFGADPTGVVDSTNAINTALASGRSVYLPAGTYLVSGALTWTTSTCLKGAGRNATTLTVPITFSTSAIGVIAPSTFSQTGACIRDLGIYFQQPASFSTTASGSSAAGQAVLTVANGANSVNGYYVYDATNPNAIPLGVANSSSYTISGGGGTTSWTLSSNIASSGVSNGDVIQFVAPRSAATPLGSCAAGFYCEFPPAIDLNNSYNILVENVFISNAWDCIDGNWPLLTSLGLNEFRSVICGAVHHGLDMAGSTGIMDISDYHFYPWGLSLINHAIYNDQGTYAGYFTNNQGETAANFFSQNGRVAITGASIATLASFSNLQMDGDGATFEVNTGGWVTVTGGYSTGSTNGIANNNCELQVASGIVAMSGHYFRNDATAPGGVICMTSGLGDLALTGNNISVGGTGVSAVTQSAGNLVFSGNDINVQSPVSWSVPLIKITGGNQTITGNYIGELGGSGTAISSSATDETSNNITGNSFGAAWTFMPPSGARGSYVGTAFTPWTPAVVACSTGTPGAYSVSAIYQRVGQEVQTHITLTVTSVGTCTGPTNAISLTVPIPGNTNVQEGGGGRDDTTGYSLNTFVQGNAIWIQKYDGTNPVVAGDTLDVSVNYVAQ